VDLSIIIVSWNVASLLAVCLQSIAAEQGNLCVETIVVDNASKDDSVTMVRRDFPAARLIANADNVGFARASNQALALARGRYVMMLNPDTRLAPGSLKTMIAFLESHSTAGMVGPLLIFPDGRRQLASAHRLPTLSSALLCDTLRLHELPLVGSWISRVFLSDYDYGRTQEVESISGACMILRHGVLERTGGFGDCFIHCGEDIDLCFRVRQAGWTIHFLSDAKVIHWWGKSVQQAPVRTTVNAALSIQHYFTRCYGTISGITYRLMVQGLQMPLTLLIGAFKLALGLESRTQFRHRYEFARAIVTWRSL